MLARCDPTRAMFSDFVLRVHGVRHDRRRLLLCFGPRIDEPARPDAAARDSTSNCIASINWPVPVEHGLFASGGDRALRIDVPSVSSV